MNVIDTTQKRIGGVFTDDVKTVIVHDGSRGPKGDQGEQGDIGEQGDSIVVKGPWSSGSTYCPLDAVRSRSSLVNHVYSLWVQVSTVPCAPSTLPPHEDTSRWQEIGPYEWGNYLGGIWEVYQIDHDFTRVGEPVAYSFESDSYILADCRRADELPIGVVREVIDADRVVLQSTGEVPEIDPSVIFPDGRDWEPGRVYYVSTVRGRLSLEQPADPQAFVCPILMPTDMDMLGMGPRNGVALPWMPSGGPQSRNYQLVGSKKFYFTIASGTSTISGTDDRGSELGYIVGDDTDVFKNGLNLISETDFTANDGTSISFTEALVPGDVVEVWTPTIPTSFLVPSTAAKLDNIEGEFDGADAIFNLSVGGTNLMLQSSSNVLLWLDGHAQESLIDYQIIERPRAPGSGLAAVQFTSPPPVGTRFWGITFEPYAPPAATNAGLRTIVTSAATLKRGKGYYVQTSGNTVNISLPSDSRPERGLWFDVEWAGDDDPNARVRIDGNGWNVVDERDSIGIGTLTYRQEGDGAQIRIFWDNINSVWRAQLRNRRIGITVLDDLINVQDTATTGQIAVLVKINGIWQSVTLGAAMLDLMDLD